MRTGTSRTATSRTVTWRHFARPVSMGMHHYEERIQQAITEVAGDGWAFGHSLVGTLRSREPCELRFPARLGTRGPRWLARPLTRSAPGLVHRFDLRLPPARREVVTVHDLPPRRFPDEGRLPDWCLESARRARGVIVPSEFAAREVSELTGAENITVIPYGLSREFENPVPADEPLLAGFGITRPYFLHAAGATQRKNLTGLAAAWRKLTAAGLDHQLVLCGPPHPNRDRAFGGLPDVLILGKQPLVTVTRLMAASTAVVVPSVYEGFGLPALEGMACSVPVVAANRGALPEVCGGAGLLAEPDAEGLATAMEHATALSPCERDLLASAARSRALTFDWNRAATAHLDGYAQYL